MTVFPAIGHLALCRDRSSLLLLPRLPPENHTITLVTKADPNERSNSKNKQQLIVTVEIEERILPITIDVAIPFD